MRNLNTVTLEGRLTRDAELKYSDNGFPILKFSIACNDRKKVGDSWEDVADFFDVTLLGKLAEAIAPRMTKAAAAVVVGRLKQNRWKDESGNNRSRVEVLADEISVYDNKTTQSAEPPF